MWLEIELLSPDQSPIRVIVIKNILYCLENRTQIGRLMDPKQHTVLLYVPNEQVKVIDERPSIISVPLFAVDVLGRWK